MTDMMNMAINDMELDNVTGGATRTKAQQRHEGQNDRQQDQEGRLRMV